MLRRLSASVGPFDRPGALAGDVGRPTRRIFERRRERRRGRERRRERRRLDRIYSKLTSLDVLRSLIGTLALANDRRTHRTALRFIRTY